MKFLKDKWPVILPAALLLIIVIFGVRVYLNRSNPGNIPDVRDVQATQAEQEAPPQRADAGQPAAQTAGTQGAQQVQAVMPGCTCHSKKPAMVRMHDALGGQNCGDCHKQGENLMDPNRPPTPKAEMDKRIKTEAACRVCHLDNGVVLSKARAKGAAKIKGALFCPKCKKQVTMKDTTCGTCGGTITRTKSGWKCSKCGPLVDVDKVAVMSEKKPSNDICRLCHFDKRQLVANHTNIDAFNKRVADVQGGLDNCLACHKSHNQCGGCHF